MQNSYPSVTGIVIEGKKIARQLGYPTINLKAPIDFTLAHGIYAGIMEYQHKQYSGVISFGITPNFKELEAKFEIHIFDFDQDLYGKIVKVIPVAFLRKEKKFENVELLIQQIEKDCAMARCHSREGGNPVNSKDRVGFPPSRE
jgi:riboflavin kinase/FMN adenylyltransferase